MESVLDDRVRRVIEELLAIQAELSAPSPGPKVGLALPKLSPELVHQLKSIIDHLRLLLWAYIDSREPEAQQGMSTSLQKARLARTTDMLRALRPEITKDGVPPAPEAPRFVGEVKAMAELVEKKPKR